jgi:mannose-6-phosphate isomerase-like protein (cupin superfamily)
MCYASAPHAPLKLSVSFLEEKMSKNKTQLVKFNVHNLTNGIEDDWKNFVVSEVNDHVVRLSVLQRDFHWHSHSKSDEVFYVIRGRLFVDLEDRTEELRPGEMITIPKNMQHRTRSKERTIILCFESLDNDVTGD